MCKIYVVYEIVTVSRISSGEDKSGKPEETRIQKRSQPSGRLKLRHTMKSLIKSYGSFKKDSIENKSKMRDNFFLPNNSLFKEKVKFNWKH